MATARTIQAISVPDELVRWQPSAHPVVSCYVDWRVGGRGVREATVVVRRRLREAASAALDRGPARDSFEADVERLLLHLDGELHSNARGLAVFACHGRGLWRTMALGVPVETDVHVGEHPLLLPLVEATQDAARTLVALLDTNTVRLISLDAGGASEAPGPHRPHGSLRTVKHSKTGGWRSASYQRAIDTAIVRFAGEAAGAIAETMTERGIDHLVIAGDGTIADPLKQALPANIRERVAAVERVDIRASLQDVAERVWPQVATVARTERDRAVERVVERAEGGHDATAEPAEVRTLVAAGRVDTLALDAEGFDSAAIELLLREALAHGSTVIVARGHASLAAVGGLAATLR